MKKYIVTLIICILFLSGCSSLHKAFYGIKSVTGIDEKTLLHYSKRFNIPENSNFEIDTSYFTYLFSLDQKLYQHQIQNHYQPLQALYFDKNGKLQSFQINCYAGGFPNLNWKRNKTMATFPPKIQAPLDTIINLSQQLRYLKPLSNLATLSTEDYDNTIVVYYAVFMGRQSKRLIRTVQKNSKLANGKNIVIIYANTDNLFANLKSNN